MTAVKRLKLDRSDSRAGRVRALVRKDLLFERTTLRMVLAWGACSSVGLFLSRYQSDITMTESATPLVISAASQLFILSSMTGTTVVPALAFMFLIQDEKTNGSFLVYRTIPVSCYLLFWSRVLGCWLLAISCELMLYLFYGLLLLFGVISTDRLTPVLFGFSYIFLLFSLSIFVSICSIALTFNVPSRLLPTVITVISALMIMSPFIFSDVTAGFDGQNAVVSYFALYGVAGGISFILLLLSLFIGGLGAWAFKLKRAYV